MAKYYAVKVGKQPGIYTSWEACKNNVHGYPNAIYKSFPSLQDAEAYMRGELLRNGPVISNTKNINLNNPPENTLIAYVDGSCLEDYRYSYGAVLVYLNQNGEKEEVFRREAYHDEMTYMRNVSGEITGSMKAIEFAKEKGLNNVIIYHDYQGIASWANGDWKTKNPHTENYRCYCAENRVDGMNIEFRKVKGHSGDFYNDVADTLAKLALGLKPEKKYAVEYIAAHDRG